MALLVLEGCLESWIVGSSQLPYIFSIIRASHQSLEKQPRIVDEDVYVHYYAVEIVTSHEFLISYSAMEIYLFFFLWRIDESNDIFVSIFASSFPSLHQVQFFLKIC